MGMSKYVRGYGPPSEKWAKMAAVYHACVAAKVELPAEVEEYFEDGPPDPYGEEVDVPNKEWTPADEGWPAHGIEVVVADIPEKVEVLRFIISY